MAKTLRRRIDLPPLSTGGATVKEEYEIEKHTERITGLLVTADRDDLLYHRGNIAVTINGEEVIPDDYHAKLLMSGLGVAPAHRYFPVDLAPGNGIVKIAYTDVQNPSIAFSPYQVSFYLQYQIDENNR
jgi:hypothetical protein